MKKSGVVTSPFSFVNAINLGRNMIREDPFSKEREKQYVPFLTNKALSYHYDTILDANQMNMSYNIPNGMQFDYYINRVRKRNRPAVWYKAEKKSDFVDKIANLYNINKDRAQEYCDLMGEKTIKTILNIGGKV